MKSIRYLIIKNVFAKKQIYQFIIMGKQVRRNLTEVDCQKRCQKSKTKRIIKNRKRLMTQSAVQEAQQLDSHQIAINLKTVLKNLSKGCGDKKDRRLSSLLGLISQPQIICSIHNIPSIENMMSHQNLKSFNELQSLESTVSFDQISSFFVIQDEPELMLNYLVMLEKAYSKMPVKLSSSQNQKVVKGLWNICIKFWSDEGEEQVYEGISFQIEWGLFSLLNFNLLVSNKERVLMRQKLKELKVSSKIL